MNGGRFPQNEDESDDDYGVRISALESERKQRFKDDFKQDLLENSQETKRLVKEAIKEVVREQFDAFSRWTIMGLLKVAVLVIFSAVVYFAVTHKVGKLTP